MRTMHTLGTTLALLLTTSAGLAHAQATDKQSGFALGLRAGYAMPMGKVGGASVGGLTIKSTDLKDGLKSAVPLQLDLGYRLNPHVYVGGYFQYAFAQINTDKGPCDGCSAKDLAFGAGAAYHILPEGAFDPWIGVSFGYEILSTSLGSGDVDFSVKGMQFVNLQLGGDFLTSPGLTVGPVVNVAIGKFSSFSASGSGMSLDGDLYNAEVHEWVTLGVRGQFTL